ncbi:MAG: 3-phosphoshikimate 1-carboxyvinyltransferase [Clostridia bacterium]|nr:3-phosphoshikimate 1-carboxyvinyltransferase [Clostridia bacterium]
MDITVKSAVLNGSVSVVDSKSEAHRKLICSLLSFGKTSVICSNTSDDINATINCLKALNAEVSQDEKNIYVDSENIKATGAELNCGESGSTLRFFIPIVCALGLNVTFTGEGRLPERTNAVLIDLLSKKGCMFDRADGLPLTVSGKIESGTYEIPGNISSQYISGLLFALPLLSGDSVIKIIGKTESVPYIDLTLEALSEFGIKADFDKSKGEIKVYGNQKYKSSGNVKVNGDWSNGAFWLCLSNLAGNKLNVENLKADSVQGDKAIVDIITKIKSADDGETVTVDCRQIPDLVPVMSVFASSRKGETVFSGCERLKIKESDRIKTTVEMITNLGGNAEEIENGIRIYGKGKLTGGTVECYNDHRIAMSSAVASTICDGDVIIKGAQCVKKSYPLFFEEFQRLGGVIERSK